MTVKKFTLCTLPFFISFSANSAKLTIQEAWVTTTCQTPLPTVLEMARNEVLKKLPVNEDYEDLSSRYQRVSPWIEEASYTKWPYPGENPELCWHASGHAKATFIEKKWAKDPDWYLNFNDQGSSRISDEVGWADATKNAQEHANTYCGGKASAPLRIQQVRIDKVSDDLKIYTIKAYFTCVKS